MELSDSSRMGQVAHPLVSNGLRMGKISSNRINIINIKKEHQKDSKTQKNESWDSYKIS